MTPILLFDGVIIACFTIYYNTFNSRRTLTHHFTKVNKIILKINKKKTTWSLLNCLMRSLKNVLQFTLIIAKLRLSRTTTQASTFPFPEQRDVQSKCMTHVHQVNHITTPAQHDPSTTTTTTASASFVSATVIGGVRSSRLWGSVSPLPACTHMPPHILHSCRPSSQHAPLSCFMEPSEPHTFEGISIF